MTLSQKFKNVTEESKNYHPRLRIMGFLLEQKIALISQIHNYCFQNKTKNAARFHVNALLHNGYVSAISTTQKDERLSMGYQLTPKGLEYFLSLSGIQIPKIQLKSNYQSHDVNLNEIRMQFENFNEVRNYLSENILQSKIYESLLPDLTSYRTHRCDAAVEIASGEKKIWLGIEYERSDKTDERLFERFRSWYQAEELKGILLVAEDTVLLNRLKRIDLKTYPHLGRKVFFSSFSGLLDASANIIFENSLGKRIVFTSGLFPKFKYPLLDQNFSFPQTI